MSTLWFVITVALAYPVQLGSSNTPPTSYDNVTVGTVPSAAECDAINAQRYQGVVYQGQGEQSIAYVFCIPVNQ